VVRASSSQMITMVGIRKRKTPSGMSGKSRPITGSSTDFAVPSNRSWMGFVLIGSWLLMTTASDL
jgi:hypothetical protein